MVVQAICIIDGFYYGIIAKSAPGDSLTSLLAAFIEAVVVVVVAVVIVVVVTVVAIST